MRAFTEAAHVVRVELINQRLVVASLEPRTATASYDAGSNRFTLRCGTQGVAGVRGQVAGAMGIKPDELRVLTDDVGGGFGMKGWCYPEYVAAAARRARARQSRSIGYRPARRPFVTDNQGRDSFWRVELALSKRGRFWACASIASAMSAPTSPASRISSSPRTSPAACRRSTTSRRRR